MNYINISELLSELNPEYSDIESEPDSITKDKTLEAKRPLVKPYEPVGNIKLVSDITFDKKETNVLPLVKGDVVLNMSQANGCTLNPLTARRDLEPLGLSSRVMPQSVKNSMKANLPPGSPALPKRPPFKTLAPLAGSLNNLAAIPEAVDSATNGWFSRDKTFGGSCDSLCNTIGKSSSMENLSHGLDGGKWRLQASFKGKPHHVPPINHTSVEIINKNKNNLAIIDSTNNVFMEIDQNKFNSKHLDKLHIEVVDADDDDEEDSSMQSVLVKENTSELYTARNVAREPSMDNLLKPRDPLRNGWQLFSEPSNLSLTSSKHYSNLLKTNDKVHQLSTMKNITYKQSKSKKNKDRVLWAKR
jgi:hypothetical protein